MNEPLEEIAKEPSFAKNAAVDTGANITFFLAVGSVLDYCAGLNFSGIVASRAYATIVNTVTGTPYGMWRDFVYRVTRTTEKSGKARKYFADLFSLNTFATPMYVSSLAFGSFLSEGHVNWEKVKHGAEYGILISPFVGPAFGHYMDFARKMFGIKSAPEKAGEK